MNTVSAAVRQNECSGEEKREVAKKNQLLGVASASIGFNAVLLMAVTKPVSFLICSLLNQVQWHHL